MARKVKDRELDSRAAREKLKARGKPYWRTIEQGVHLGYRRLRGKAGTWWSRHYLGDQEYRVEPIGPADDLSDADGVAILSYWQAVDKARERMVQRAHAAAGKRGPLIVDDVMADYLKFLETKRKPTRTARSHDRSYIHPKLGRLVIENLTTPKIEGWRDDMANGAAHVRTAEGEPQRFKDVDDEDEDEVARRRQATANRTLTTLKAALNRAWRQGKIASDQAWRRVEPFHGVDAARVRYLTIAESQRLINACPADFRRLVQGALQSGARYGQLARTLVSDFDPEKGTLRLTTRKGRGKLKVFHAVLSDEGAAFFKEACAGRGSSARIFLKADGTQWRESDQSRPMVEACEVAKIDPPIGFHGLRHTWASHAVMNGVPLLVVAKNMGHSDTRMVEKHYGHLAPSYVVDAIRAGAPKFGFKPDGKIATLRA
jgi:integrase